MAPAAYPDLFALQPPEEPEDKPAEAEGLLGVERTPSGRVRRTSAQVAVFHLQEIAEDELARDWTKRQMKDDLVPETARVSPPVSAGRTSAWGPCDLGHLLTFPGSLLSVGRQSRVSLDQLVVCRLSSGPDSPWCLPVFTAQLHSARPPHTQPPAAGGVEERSQGERPRQLPQ